MKACVRCGHGIVGNVVQCERCGSVTLRETHGIASSANGFGTALYGLRDVHPDGSYLTTKFVTVAYLPVVPLKTLRVKNIRTTVSHATTRQTSRSSSVIVLEEDFPDLWQVLCVYVGAVIAAGLPVAALVFSYQERLPPLFAAAITVASMVTPLWMHRTFRIWLWRRRVSGQTSARV